MKEPLNINGGPPVEAKAMRTRRSYDAAFKESAVDHFLRHGGDYRRTASELGVNHWALRDWVRARQRRAQPPAQARTASEIEAENLRLRAELARVTEQRDILKKSLGILSLP